MRRTTRVIVHRPNARPRLTVTGMTRAPETAIGMFVFTPPETHSQIFFPVLPIVISRRLRREAMSHVAPRTRHVACTHLSCDGDETGWPGPEIERAAIVYIPTIYGRPKC